MDCDPPTSTNEEVVTVLHEVLCELDIVSFPTTLDILLVRVVVEHEMEITDTATWPVEILQLVTLSVLVGLSQTDRDCALDNDAETELNVEVDDGMFDTNTEHENEDVYSLVNEP